MLELNTPIPYYGLRQEIKTALVPSIRLGTTHPGLVGPEKIGEDARVMFYRGKLNILKSMTVSDIQVRYCGGKLTFVFGVEMASVIDKAVGAIDPSREALIESS